MLPSVNDFAVALAPGTVLLDRIIAIGIVLIRIFRMG